jgi:hypothetical protein
MRPNSQLRQHANYTPMAANKFCYERKKRILFYPPHKFCLSEASCNDNFIHELFIKMKIESENS